MNTMQKWARLKYNPCMPLGDNNSKITGSEKHIALSKEAATEGIVLLKNEKNILPLKKETKIAIFGMAQIDYIKGGGGSGDVHPEYIKNIYEAFSEKGADIFEPLSHFYINEVKKAYKAGQKAGLLTEIRVPEDLLRSSKEYTDTALITLNRFSEEGFDRLNDGTDAYYVLSEDEKKLIKAVTDNFDKVIVTLNTGTMIDSLWYADNPKIQSVLMIWQGGMEGAAAAADIIYGDECPSGRLVDTCAADLNDYPSSEGFYESDDYVKYIEDIFVGYRYFETIPNMNKNVVYPFGYGLSYTKFEFSDIRVFETCDKINVSLNIKNIGDYAGKEVVQIYVNAPCKKMTKPKYELKAFQKTKKLLPGEVQNMIISFDISSMASFDDLGVISVNSYVMEKGAYKLYIGNSVRNLEKTGYEYILESDRITEKLNSYCTPANLGKRLVQSGEYIKVDDIVPQRKDFPCTYICNEKIPKSKEDIKTISDYFNGKISLDDFIAQMTNEELSHLLIGQPNIGVSDTDSMGNLRKFDIPTVMTADGPQGVRIIPETGIRTTAFPAATMLACTWNTALVEEIGKAGAMECKENNIFMWLTPALNIHRNPLCGRNFEYYSEDPLISGKMAAAMVRGIQSQKIAATPKHFALNNKETGKKDSDSIVSKRALREIYLKGFEICVKEAKPKLIMTAYNIVNGKRASENAELIMGILREEWGFDGLVITDWWNHASKTQEIIAGNDIRMPYGSTNDAIEGIKNGTITRNQLAVCVKRLLEVILWLD